MPLTRTTSFVCGSHLKASFCTASEIAAWHNPAADALSMQPKKIISLTVIAADAVSGHCIQLRSLLLFVLLLTKDGKNENFYSRLCKSNYIPFKLHFFSDTMETSGF